MAPTPLSTVCFRARPRDFGEESSVYQKSPDQCEAYLDKLNETLMANVNQEGKCFLSHTKLNGKFALRLAIGNIRTARKHVEMVWDVLQTEADRLDGTIRPAHLSRH